MGSTSESRIARCLTPPPRGGSAMSSLELDELETRLDGAAYLFSPTLPRD